MILMTVMEMEHQTIRMHHIASNLAAPLNGFLVCIDLISLCLALLSPDLGFEIELCHPLPAGTEREEGWWEWD